MAASKLANGFGGRGWTKTRSNAQTFAHVLMIPYPAQPHIIPMVDVAHRLVEAGRGSIRVTVVSFQVLIDRLKIGNHGAFHLVGVPDDLPPATYIADDIPEDPVVLRESLQLKYNMESLVLRLLQDRQDLQDPQGPTCVLSDIMHWWSTDTASRLKVPRYVLSCNPASMLLLFVSCPANGYEAVEGDGLICVHDCFPPLLFRNLPACTQMNDSSALPILSRWPKSLRESDGIVVNTCLELESDVIDALRIALPEIPVLPVGPLGQSPALFPKNISMEGLPVINKNLVMSWLDQQPSYSVLYVCFGTTGMFYLGKRHVHELARGLDASQQRFVWALRAPPNVQDDGDLLPFGFEEKVVQEGRGLILRGWAPQLKILEHVSTGAFLSSCGWNSTVESLARAVPIIGWPSFADQPLISKYVAAKLRVGIELQRKQDWFVEADEIARAVRLLLLSDEGTAMRKRAEMYRSGLHAALAPGGSSSKQLQQFVAVIRNEIQ